MIETRRWDALFVINRLSPSERVARLAHQCRASSVLVVSTHGVFPSEQATLAALLPSGTALAWLSFADYIDDQSAAEIDEDTTRELATEGAAAARAGTYVARYQTAMTTRKNRYLALRLRQTHPWSLGWCDDGLGLDSAAWCAFGVRRLSPCRLRDLVARFPMPGILYRVRTLFSKPRVRTLIDASGDTYVFLGQTRRLRLAPGVRPIEEPLKDALARPGQRFAASTIHDHSLAVYRLGLPVKVFADGLLPSNYPRSYIDAYHDTVFVANDPAAERWFTLCGKPSVRPPGFIDTPRMSPPRRPNVVRSVLLSLNHTGDWCAHINRSDTDLLVMTFVRLAEEFSGLRFTVRPHPAMDHPDHEGPGARERLARFVREAGLANLVLSQTDAATDFAQADLVMSEYSATLLDAWRAGKPGLAVNLTRRRSFMADYEQLGFSTVETFSVLHEFFADPEHGISLLCLRQEQAVNNYNALIDRWRNGA